MTDKRVQTGEKPHDFTLTDTQGEEITLSKFEGKKIVYLVFNRGFF
jgi:peroxiredoxin